MGIKASLFKAMIAAFALSVATAASATVPDLKPLNYKIRYDVTWGGLRIGRIRVSVREDAAQYTMVVDTKTGGIGRLFSSEKTVARAQGAAKDGRYIPASYHTHNDNNGQHTDIAYGGDGIISKLERVPPNTGKGRAIVSAQEINAAADPVTAFFNLRQQLHGAMAQNVRDVTTHTFDGVRLAELAMHVVSPAKVEINGTYEDAINIVIARKPINGYSAKELKKYKEGDPTIHLFFSADGRFIPLKAEIQTSFGAVAATLVEIQ